MNALAWTYVGYLAVITPITIWVGRTLKRHGGLFLTRDSTMRDELAGPLTHLLVVGFYLLSFGAMSFCLKSREAVTDMQTGLEALSMKVGLMLVLIAGTHFLFVVTFLKSLKKHAASGPPTDSAVEYAGALGEVADQLRTMRSRDGGLGT